MTQIVYVDLSAKVEHWNSDSAIAIADGFSVSYLVPAKTKQAARRWIVERYGTKSAKYRVLALFVYLAVRDYMGSIQQHSTDCDRPRLYW